jgi:hypothetical protein
MDKKLFVIVREVHRLKIFGPKWVEVIRGREKLCSDVLWVGSLHLVFLRSIGGE